MGSNSNSNSITHRRHLHSSSFSNSTMDNNRAMDIHRPILAHINSISDLDPWAA